LRRSSASRAAPSRICRASDIACSVIAKATRAAFRRISRASCSARCSCSCALLSIARRRLAKWASSAASSLALPPPLLCAAAARAADQSSVTRTNAEPGLPRAEAAGGVGGGSSGIEMGAGIGAAVPAASCDSCGGLSRLRPVSEANTLPTRATVDANICATRRGGNTRNPRAGCKGLHQDLSLHGNSCRAT